MVKNAPLKLSNLHCTKNIVCHILAIATFGATADASCCDSVFKGFYVGGNLGFVSGRSSENYDATIPVGGVFISTKDKVSVQGIQGGVNAGYTHVFSSTPIAIGFEGVADWSNIKGSHSVSAGTNVGNVNGTLSVQTRLKQSFQLFTKLGYSFEKFMPYLKFGWDNSLWSQKTTLNVNSAAGPLVVNANKHKRINGLAYGIGIDVALTNHFVMGLDFTHTDFQKVKFASSDNIANASFKPHTNKFSLVMKYVFK